MMGARLFPADNGTWYVMCTECKLFDSGHTFYKADEIADTHNLTHHDGE